MTPQKGWPPPRSWFTVRAVADVPGDEVPPVSTPAEIHVEVNGVPCIFSGTVVLSIDRSGK